MYNDCWPAVGLALVDHYLIPKAGYYAAKRAAQPVIASIIRNGEQLEVWALNDSLQMATGELEVFFQYPDGVQKPAASAAFVSPANESMCVCCLASGSVACSIGKKHDGYLPNKRGFRLRPGVLLSWYSRRFAICSRRVRNLHCRKRDLLRGERSIEGDHYGPFTRVCTGGIL